MDRRPIMPKQEKPKKPEYISPRKPWKPKKFRRAAAALLAGLITLNPVPAKSSLIRESEPPAFQLTNGIDGEYAFQGGKAKIRYLHPDLGTMEGVYEITLYIEGRRFPPTMQFRGPPPGSLGSGIGVSASERKTVIVTNNYIITAQGYRDLLDGSRLGDQSSCSPLPEGLRGNVFAAAAAEGPGGELGTVFALSHDTLWAVRTDAPGSEPLRAEVSLEGRPTLKSFGKLAVLIQPSSSENFVKVFSPDFDSGDLTEACTRGSEVTFGPGAEVKEVPGGFSVSDGVSEALVLFDIGEEVRVASSP